MEVKPLFLSSTNTQTKNQTIKVAELPRENNLEREPKAGSRKTELDHP